MTGWTNDRAIAQSGTMPRAVLEQTARDGDFAKRHLPSFLIAAARRAA